MTGRTVRSVIGILDEISPMGVVAVEEEGCGKGGMLRVSARRCSRNASDSLTFLGFEFQSATSLKKKTLLGNELTTGLGIGKSNR